MDDKGKDAVCSTRMLGGTASGAPIKRHLSDFAFAVEKKYFQQRVSVWMDANVTVGLSHAALVECSCKYEDSAGHSR